MSGVDTLDSLLSSDPLDIVLPTAPLPENLADQRQWAEVRKLQVDTERAAAELDAYRRREADNVAEEGRRTYTFYARVEEESVRFPLPVASTLPSGENARQRTERACASKRLRS